MKKRMLALALASFMLLGTLAGCGGSSNSGAASSAAPAGSAAASAGSTDAGNSGTYKIGLSMALRDQFLSTLEAATIKAAEEAGVELATFDANSDVATQLSHVQTCASGGYDAMIVNLVNVDSAAEMVDLAGDMKLIFVNRMPTDTSILCKDVVYVGSNELDSGRLQGEFLANYFNEQGKTDVNGILFMGTLGQDSTNKRTDSAKKAMADAGINVTWVYEDTADYDRAKAMDKMTQLLGDNSKNFDFILSNNDDMALGAIEAMKVTLGEVPCPVVGIDGTATGCEAIVSGDMSFSVFQNAAGQGGGTIDCALRMLNGDDMADLDNFVHWIPFEPINADNVSDYM